MIERLNNDLDAEQAEKVMLQEQLQQERDKTKKLSKFVELSAMNLCYFKTLVIPTNTQFYNLCILSITRGSLKVRFPILLPPNNYT